MATNDNGYIIIEGNIGVGKSTFSRILADAFIKREKRAEYLLEPDDKTNPFLAAYYADPKGTAYKMQMHLLHRRFRDTRYAQAAADPQHRRADQCGAQPLYGDRFSGQHRHQPRSMDRQ
jgi:deoxyadenosine/deoxycytidine kinase